MIKKCNNCWEIKEINEFRKYRNSCKKCERLKYPNKIYYEKNKEKILKQKKEYYIKNKEKIMSKIDREQRRKYDKIYKEKNREKIKQYRLSDHFKMLARIKRAKRRALIKTVDDWTINKDSILDLLEKQNYKCNITWNSLLGWFELDHIIPLSKWWLHTISNIQLTTMVANRSKWNKIL